MSEGGAPSSGGRANSNAGSSPGGDSGGSDPCPSTGCECDPGETRCSGAQPEVCQGGRWAPSGAACLAAHLCEEGTCTEFPSCSGLAPRCGAAADESCCESLAVPGGTFNRSNDEQYPATVSSFRLDKFEITVGRFRRFVDAVVGGWRPEDGAGKHIHLNDGLGLVHDEEPSGYERGWDSAWDGYLFDSKSDWDDFLACDSSFATWTPNAGANENRPMNCADWYQLRAFCIWDGGFMPSAAEWNYAAAGGDQQRSSPWGGALDADHAIANCWYNGSGGDTCTGIRNIAPVGAKPLGHARWGHSDLIGSVREFLLCGYDYPVPCVDCLGGDPTGPAATDRGGSYAAITSQGIAQMYTTFGRRASARTPGHPEIGARCARTP